MAEITSSDYYVRLGITPKASQEEIKAAFFSMVREYPPQKSPDEYKLIREAYDILKNPVTREDYDSRLMYGPEIETLNKQLDQAIEDENWSKAEATLKKLINFQPKSSLLRKRLGQVYLNMEKYDLALKSYKTAAEIDPDDSSNLVDIAYAYREMKSFAEAEHYYRQAADLDESNIEAIRGLAFMYWFQADRKKDAIKELEQAIDRDGRLDFQDFFYILDLLRMHLFGNEIVQMQKRLNQMSAIINRDDDKKMVMSSILGLIDLAVRFQYFKESAVLYRFLGKLDDDMDWPKNAMIVSQTQEFFDRKDCNELVRLVTLLLTMYYFGSISDEEKENLDKLQELLFSQIDVSSPNAEIQQAIRIMKREYNYLYAINPKKWDTLLEWSPRKYGAKCPHCDGFVNAPMRDYGQYNCPHCSKAINYSTGGYSKVATGGCLVPILMLLLTIMAAAYAGCGTLF